MNLEPKGALVVLAAVVLVAGPAAASQRATASLIPVESGRLDAGIDGAGREMCLRPGLFVLAFARGFGDDTGTAMVGTDAPWVAEPVALIVLSESGQDRWAWRAFDVDAPTCFRLAALNGSARVYSLRVGVDW